MPLRQKEGYANATYVERTAYASVYATGRMPLGDLRYANTTYVERTERPLRHAYTVG
jgi:hypothetical protein